MVKDSDWLTAFQISKQLLADWENQMPKGQNILFWALKTGKMDEGTYLHWASNHYQIPSVQKEFFNSPANVKLWQRVQQEHAWKQEFFPILEWEGTVFIGCILSPPQDFNWDRKHSYLIAPPSGLSKWWTELNTQEEPPEITVANHPFIKPPDVATSTEAEQPQQNDQTTQPASIPEPPPAAGIEIGPPPGDTAKTMAPSASPEVPVETPNQLPEINLGASTTPEPPTVSQTEQPTNPNIDLSNLTPPPETGQSQPVESPATNLGTPAETETPTAPAINLGTPTETETPTAPAINLGTPTETETPAVPTVNLGAPENETPAVPTVNLGVPAETETPAAPTVNSGHPAEPETPTAQPISLGEPANEETTAPGINLAQKTTESDNAQAINLSAPPPSTEEETQEVTQEAPTSPPAPPTAEEKPGSLNLSWSPPKVTASESPATDDSSTSDAPQGLNLPAMESQSNEASEAPEDMAFDEITKKQNFPIEHGQGSSEGVSKQGGPNFPKTPKVNSDKYPTGLKTEEVASQPVSEPPPPPPPRPSAPDSLDKVTNMDSLVAYTFHVMNSHYDKSMFLILKDNNLKPWEWSEDWKPDAAKTKDVISLNTPSIFRIVVNTNLPYHGYIVESPINRAFFNTWNSGKIPGFVSIMPIVVNGQLEYLLLGIGKDKVNGARAQVYLARLAEEISAMFYQLSGQAA